MSLLYSDTKTLRTLARRLRDAQPDMYKATQAALRVEGNKIRDRAKQNASWSTRIPKTTRSSVAGVNAVRVSAGGKTAPHAAAYEHAGAPGTFRHPLFGNREYWYDEPARPFLHPAALDHIHESAAAVADALTVQVEKTIHGQEVWI